MIANESKQKYGTTLTAAGKAAIAAAVADNTLVDIQYIAVGTGNGAEYEPDESQTALKKEVYQIKVNSVEVDKNNANWVVVKALIPETVGGWFIREIALKLGDGTVAAVGSYPTSYKPKLDEGTALAIGLAFILEVTNASVVMMNIDPSTVYATVQYVDDAVGALAGLTDGLTPETRKINTKTPLKGGGNLTRDLNLEIQDGSASQKGAVQLSAAINSSSETLAATPSAVKKAYDLAATKAPLARKVTFALPLSGSGTLAADLTVSIKQATDSSSGAVILAKSAEVQTGTDAAKAVTPKTLSDRTASASRTGLAALASAAETQAGTNAAKIVTPQTLSSRTATTARTGLIRVGTAAEVAAGAISDAAVVPSALKPLLASFMPLPSLTASGVGRVIAISLGTVLPAGGTWFFLQAAQKGANDISFMAGIVPGGTTINRANAITGGHGGAGGSQGGIAIRIS